MHAKTALAVAGSVLAVPSAALAATDDNHAPDRDALHPSGKLTHDEELKDRTGAHERPPLPTPATASRASAACRRSR